MFVVTEFDQLVRKLDRRNRVLVLHVSQSEDGREQPSLWIAAAKEPIRKLELVDSELVGRAILSDQLVRGPDVNTWSHRKRLAANRKLVATAEYKAAVFIRRNLMVNKAFGLLTLVGIGAVIATLVVIEVTRPKTDMSDPVTLRQGADALSKERDATICYPRGSSACVDSAN
ncbi:MAG: hypothetical protein RIC36_09920 [Rhodospirillales bacterium]